MPSNLVKTPRDRHLWDKAKALATEQGHTEDWPYITGIFQKMKGEGARRALIHMAAEDPSVREEVLGGLQRTASEGGPPPNLPLIAFPMHRIGENLPKLHMALRNPVVRDDAILRTLVQRLHAAYNQLEDHLYENYIWDT